MHSVDLVGYRIHVVLLLLVVGHLESILASEKRLLIPIDRLIVRHLHLAPRGITLS